MKRFEGLTEDQRRSVLRLVAQNARIRKKNQGLQEPTQTTSFDSALDLASHQELEPFPIVGFDLISEKEKRNAETNTVVVATGMEKGK